MPKFRLSLLVASVFFCFWSSAVLSNHSAQAQTQPTDAISLTAIPPRVGEDGEINIKPGEKFQTTVRIANTSNVDLDVETFVKDFIIGEDGRTPIQVKESVENRWSLASWVILAPSRQTIPAKKTVGVNVVIEVPKDARPGGHYAMILHQPSTAGSNTGEVSSTGINQKVGSLLYVNVAGPIDELAFVRGFAFHPNWAEFGPLQFNYAVDNQSDVHIRPNANITISDIFRRQVGQMTIESQNVFPGSQRAFTGSWPVRWGFGPYKAILNVTYGEHGQIATAETVVWLFPVTIILAVLVGILTILTIIWFIKRRNQPPTSQVSVDTTASPTNPPAPPLV